MKQNQINMFQRDGLNISIQRWIIREYQKWLSEEESKFITLFDKRFKIIKACIMTRMDNMIKHYTFFWVFFCFPGQARVTEMLTGSNFEMKWNEKWFQWEVKANDFLKMIIATFFCKNYCLLKWEREEYQK